MLGSYGFFQEKVAARGACVPHHVLTRIPTENDYGYLRKFLVINQRLAEFQSVDIRQTDVHHNHIGLMFLEPVPTPTCQIGN